MKMNRFLIKVLAQSLAYLTLSSLPAFATDLPWNQYPHWHKVIERMVQREGTLDAGDIVFSFYAPQDITLEDLLEESKCSSFKAATADELVKDMENAISNYLPGTPGIEERDQVTPEEMKLALQDFASYLRAIGSENNGIFKKCTRTFEYYGSTEYHVYRTDKDYFAFVLGWPD